MKLPLLAVAGAFTCGVTSTAFAESTQTIGWIENVRIQPENVQLIAKIDTGADNSSVHAHDVEIYEKDGTKMVKLAVVNKKGKRADFNLPLVRMTAIKRKGAESLMRPVVNMALCIGDTLKNVHLNLSNRENFKYRMLIGRSFLKGLYVVDSSRQYTIEPSCKDKTPAT